MNQVFLFSGPCPAESPHKLTHVRASPDDCAAGWAQATSVAQDLRALRLSLAEQPAVVRTAVEMYGCCARESLAEALLSQHIDGVTRAGSAGTKSGSRARSLVLLTMLAPVSRTPHGSGTSYSSATKRTR